MPHEIHHKVYQDEGLKKTQGYNDKDKERWSICNVEWTVLFDLLLCVILIPINLLLYIKAKTC